MITSPHNEKLKLVRKLLNRRRDREREGLFVAEGEDLVAAGLAAGSEPLFLLRQAGEEPQLPGADRAIEVKRKLLAEVSSLGSGCRILGVWPEIWADLEPDGDRQAAGGASTTLPLPYVFLDGVADPGNVGAVLRSNHALTAGTVVLGPGCADPFAPKAVRASMGSIFSRPPARAELAQLPRPRLGLAAHGGRWPLEKALEIDGFDTPKQASGQAVNGSLTICLGSERSGLSLATVSACDGLVTIPLPGGAESLNVAAAAAICLERVSSLAVLATGSELNPPNEETDA